jgi:hypothetical protein
MVGVVALFGPQHLSLKAAVDIGSLALKPFKVGVVLFSRRGAGPRR